MNWLEIIGVEAYIQVAIVGGDMMNNQYREQDQVLLAEIFAIPSNVIKTERFVAETANADCSGKCVSGRCQAVEA